MNNSARENFVEIDKNAITGKINSLDEMKNFLRENNFTKFGIEKIAQSFMAKITDERTISVSGNTLKIGESLYKISEDMRIPTNKAMGLQKNTNSRAMMILEHNLPMIPNRNLPVQKTENLPAVANDNTDLVAA